MKRASILVAVALAIAWSAVSNAALAPEVEEALALATGKIPVAYAPRSASLGNSVVVESISIPAGDTGTVGIYLTNDISIRQFDIPLSIRSIEGGSAYMTELTGSFNGGSRINGYLNGEYHDTVYAAPIINMRSYYDESSNSFYGPPLVPDYVSPDAILFVRMRILAENDLPPGSDGIPGEGVPMMLMKFRVNSHPGQFEIDTCFIQPGVHLGFIYNKWSVSPFGITMLTPEFTKGVITITKGVMTITGDNDSGDPPDSSVVEDMPQPYVSDTVVADWPSDTIVVDPTVDTVIVDIPGDTASIDPGIVIIDPPLDTFPVWDTTDIGAQPFDSTETGRDSDIKSPDAFARDVPLDPVTNYPNPFNAGTTIRYSVTQGHRVSVVVYDLLGRTVSTLVDRYQTEGDYSIPWDGHDAQGRAVPAGIYLIRVRTGDVNTVGKMVLLK